MYSRTVTVVTTKVFNHNDNNEVFEWHNLDLLTPPGDYLAGEVTSEHSWLGNIPDLGWMDPRYGFPCVILYSSSDSYNPGDFSWITNSCWATSNPELIQTKDFICNNPNWDSGSTRGCRRPQSRQ